MSTTLPLVINTGPLLALFAATGDLRPLRRVAERVIVPYEVEQEILAGGKNSFAVDLYHAETWIERRLSPTHLISFIANSIDHGEAAVLSMALHENIPNVCLDDQSARHVARLSGLLVTGSLGVLIAAKDQGEPISIRDAIANMRKQGIWLSNELIEEVLKKSGE